MSATCRGDVSIITHMWTDVNALPIVNQNAPHQCIDFNKVMDYSRDNSVDVYQENYIIHPKFGKSTKPYLLYLHVLIFYRTIISAWA